MRQKRILVISPTPTHPQTQGNRQRIYHFCRNLMASGYRIDFIWYAIEWGGATTDSALNDMKECWDNLFVVPVNTSRSFSPENDGYWNASLESMIQWCSQQFEYDIAIVNYAIYSKACELFNNSQTVTAIDTHDILSGRHDMLANSKLKSEFYSLSVEEEKRYLDRADIVIAIQEIEAEKFSKMALKNICTIGHDCIPLSCNLPDFGINSAGIIGSANNVSVGYTQKLIHILEENISTFPANFKLILAGGLCTQLDGPLPEFVTVLGKIETLEEFYSAVNVVIVPPETGTGLKIKAVEAISTGAAVMSTEHAFIGLNSHVSEHQYKSLDALVHGLPDILESEDKINLLRQESSMLFDKYKKKTREQMMDFEHRVSQISAKKQSSFIEYDPDEIDFGMPTLIYGAGVGGKIILSEFEQHNNSKIYGFIDRVKSGEFVNDLPIHSINQLLELDCHQYQVILSIISSDWKNVYYEMEKIGFHKVISAADFLKKRM